MKCDKCLVGILRISLGWLMFWAFLDKTFGLSAGPESAWINGNSPTAGFLEHSPLGPLADVYHSMAGSPVVDWLFMMGLLFIGICLILGIGLRVAGYSGALMMLLMWAAVLPPEHNPLIDDHIINMLIFLVFAVRPELGGYLGLGEKWSGSSIVKKNPWLR